MNMINGRVTIRLAGLRDRSDLRITCGTGWDGIVETLMRRFDEIAPTHGVITVNSSATTGIIDIRVGGEVPTEEHVLCEAVLAICRAENRSKRTCELCGSHGDVRQAQLPHSMVMATRCDDCVFLENFDVQ